MEMEMERNEPRSCAKAVNVTTAAMTRIRKATGVDDPEEVARRMISTIDGGGSGEDRRATAEANAAAAERRRSARRRTLESLRNDLSAVTVHTMNRGDAQAVFGRVEDGVVAGRGSTIHLPLLTEL